MDEKTINDGFETAKTASELLRSLENVYTHERIYQITKLMYVTTAIQQGKKLEELTNHLDSCYTAAHTIQKRYSSGQGAN